MGNLIHGQEAQLGTPTDSLSFSGWFLLDRGNAHFDDVIYTCCYLFFHLEASPADTVLAQDALCQEL